MTKEEAFDLAEDNARIYGTGFVLRNKSVWTSLDPRDVFVIKSPSVSAQAGTEVKQVLDGSVTA